MQRFLLAYDGSESARQAVVIGTEMAKKYGATVVVVTVGESAAHAEQRQEAEHKARRLSQEGAALLAEQGVVAVPVTRLGDPGSEILQAVNDERCDLIIMGHRGVTTSRIWVLGSVALRVINYAICPVLVIRGGALPTA